MNQTKNVLTAEPNKNVSERKNKEETLKKANDLTKQEESKNVGEETTTQRPNQTKTQEDSLQQTKTQENSSQENPTQKIDVKKLSFWLSLLAVLIVGVQIVLNYFGVDFQIKIVIEVCSYSLSVFYGEVHLFNSIY